MTWEKVNDRVSSLQQMRKKNLILFYLYKHIIYDKQTFFHTTEKKD